MQHSKKIISINNQRIKTSLWKCQPKFLEIYNILLNKKAINGKMWYCIFKNPKLHLKTITKNTSGEKLDDERASASTSTSAEKKTAFTLPLNFVLFSLHLALAPVMAFVVKRKNENESGRTHTQLKRRANVGGTMGRCGTGDLNELWNATVELMGWNLRARINERSNGLCSKESGERRGSSSK